MKTLFDWSFAVVGRGYGTFYQSAMTTLGSFKISLSKFLDNYPDPDKPPVTGNSTKIVPTGTELKYSVPLARVNYIKNPKGNLMWPYLILDNIKMLDRVSSS